MTTTIAMAAGAAVPGHAGNTTIDKTDGKAVSKPASKAATAVFSKVLEGVFTAAIIFSITLMPFVMLQALAPVFMTSVIQGPAVAVLVPYVFVMVGVGLKVSSLFGCSAWFRIVDRH